MQRPVIMGKAIQIILLTCLLLTCEENNEGKDGIISSGSSFGECIGYCIQELVVSSETVTYTSCVWDSAGSPDLVYQTVLTATEWEDLVSLADLSALQAFEDVIGCPDCADGGSEWIKFESKAGSKQIIFEYGDTLSGIQPLIEQLRTMRASYESELFYEES